MFSLWQLLVIIPNTVILLLLLFSWLKEHYVIVDLETWNTIATYYNEHIEAENDNCGGGIGFYTGSDSDCEEDEEDE